MQTCPNCRARNPGEITCRRCGMDLQLLLATRTAAEQARRNALKAILQGRDDQARAALRHAQHLAAEPLDGFLLKWLASLSATSDSTAARAEIESLT